VTAVNEQPLLGFHRSRRVHRDLREELLQKLTASCLSDISPTSEIMYSRQQLADDFRILGVAPGDTVMLHASVRAVGEVAGGPDQIHLALKDALTEEGSLMMLAGCPQYVDEVGAATLRRSRNRKSSSCSPRLIRSPRGRTGATGSWSSSSAAIPGHW
jgi:aminoglycoside N3'-acetyltransferase